MNRRAAFGDFLGAAHHQLGTPPVFRTAIARGGDMTEIRHSFLRIVLVMGRHVQDITATGPHRQATHPGRLPTHRVPAQMGNHRRHGRVDHDSTSGRRLIIGAAASVPGGGAAL